MKGNFKILATMLIAQVLILTACPTSALDIKKAADASYRLPAATNDLIAKISEGEAAGLISASKAKEFGLYLNGAAKAEVVFVGLVKAANATISQAEADQAAGKITPAAVKSIRDAQGLNLRQFFDLNILTPFLNTLQAIGLLSAEANQLIGLAVTAVKALLSTIGRGLGSAAAKNAKALALIYTSQKMELA